MTKYALCGMAIFCLLIAPLALLSETKTETIEKSFTIDDSKPVFLEFKEEDGDLKFSTWERSEVRVIVKKSAKEKSEQRASELLAKTKVEMTQTGNSIRVEIVYPKIRAVIFGFSDYPRVKIETEIMLPHKTNMTCRADDGFIQGENVEGDLSLRTDDGMIRVSRIHGSLSVKTEDGRIECSDIMGSVEASSDDGDIRISGQMDWLDIRTEDGDVQMKILPGSIMTRDWKIRTDDGDVELYAPQDFAARIRIKTDDGDIDNEFPSAFSKISSDKDITGQINQGDSTIFIDTEDGNITLRTAK